MPDQPIGKDKRTILAYLAQLVQSPHTPMRFAIRLAPLVLVLFVALPAGADKKSKKEEQTQVLDLPKDLPTTVLAEPQRLSFQVAPLLNKGLLSAQVRDSIKALWHQQHGAQIIRLRAFVAGTGDSRRVQAIVSEEFSGHKLPLPVLTVVQVGALPQENAQVSLESTSSEKKVVNPNGVLFISGQQVTDPDPEAATGPLLTQSLDALAKISTGADMLNVTCYVSLLPDAAARQTASARFPGAAFQVVQLRRASVRGLAECEGIARPEKPVTGLELKYGTTGYSQLAAVNTPHVLFSSAQLGFQNTDADIRLAFTRLEKALEGAGGSLKQAAVLHMYALHSSVSEKVLAIRPDFVNREHPPASTLLPVEGLPSLDAAFSIDAAVAKID